MLTYPLVNFKDLLPWSALFLYALFIKRKELDFPPEIRTLTSLFFLNYLPYWVSDASGRYILPLYPLLAIIFSYYLYRAFSSEGFKRLTLYVVAFTVALRFFYGLFLFPYMEQKETSRKKIAIQIAELVQKDSSIACQCPEEKSVCLYVGLWSGRPLKNLKHTQAPQYVINCAEPVGATIWEYTLKGKTIRLEKMQ